MREYETAACHAFEQVRAQITLFLYARCLYSKANAMLRHCHYCAVHLLGSLEIRSSAVVACQTPRAIDSIARRIDSALKKKKRTRTTTTMRG